MMVKKISGEFIFGAVINTKSVGGMFGLDENIFKINDGKFEIVLVRKLDSVIEIPHVLYKPEKEYDNKEIILIQASRIKFSSLMRLHGLLTAKTAAS